MGEQRVVIVSGHVSEAELAAVTVALQLHRAPGDGAQRPPSRWARAARLESCGHPPIGSPTQFSR